MVSSWVWLSAGKKLWKTIRLPITRNFLIMCLIRTDRFFNSKHVLRAVPNLEHLTLGSNENTAPLHVIFDTLKSAIILTALRVRIPICPPIRSGIDYGCTYRYRWFRTWFLKKKFIRIFTKYYCEKAAEIGNHDRNYVGRWTVPMAASS